MVTGTSVQGSKDALALAHRFPGIIYSTAGIHPHDAKTWTDETYGQLKKIAQRDVKCIAIGECGLDYDRNYSPQEVQRAVFEKHIQLAIELKKPLFVHERDAHEDLVTILSKYKDELPPTLIHCFTGTVAEAQRYIEIGVYIGLTGFLWKDRSENGVRKILEDGLIPLDRLMVNTDSPYIYPNIKKLPANIRDSFSEHSKAYHKFCTFKRNEPCALPIIIEMIAAYLKVDPKEIAMKTAFNACKVFGLMT